MICEVVYILKVSNFVRVDVACRLVLVGPVVDTFLCDLNSFSPIILSHNILTSYTMLFRVNFTVIV